MNLVVFDIDGTLTRTMDVDTECFMATVRDLLDMDPRGLKWTDFPHVTDQGVLERLYDMRFGRPPDRNEVEAFINHFVDLLMTEQRREAGRFSRVPGASGLFEALDRDSGWTFALATGGWSRPARFKLETADLYRHGTPTATADDHSTREGIFRTAVERSVAARGGSSFERVVSVGDGAWDVQTARNLEVAFIGVGSQDWLAQIGSPVGLEDYRDLNRAFELIETAPVP